MLRGLLIRFIVIAGLPVSFLCPFAGLLLYLWYSHGHPNDFVWDQYQFQNGALFISIATIAGYLIFELRRSPLRLRGLKLILLFWVWIALATMLATDTSLAIPKLSQFTRIFVITFLVAAMANSESRIRTLLYTLAGSVGVLGAKGALDFILTGGAARLQGPGGLMGEENEYALAMDMAIPLLFALAKVEDRPWVRRLLYVMAVGCGITTVGTHSRSGFLGLALAAFLVAFYSNRKWVGVIVLAAACMAFVRFAPPAAIRRYESIPTAAQDDESAIGRIQAWETAWGMIKAHPFFGVGPLNFELTFPQYSNYKPRAPHNAYIALLAESGIPSCLLFVAFVCMTIARMWRMRRKLQFYPGNSHLAAYCLAIQVSITVYMIPNCFINRQNQDLMYHLIGVSVGLAAVAQQRLREQRRQKAEALREEPGMELEPVNA